MAKMIGLVLMVALTAAGCGGSEPGQSIAPSNDRAVDTLGVELFAERVIGSVPGCVTCHSMGEGVILVGPSLFELADRAGSQVPGLTASEYVRQSIVDPDAFVVPGFSSGQMIGGWAEILSDAQIDSLVELLVGS